MSVFKYRIMRGNRQMLINWINADSRQDALMKLEDVKRELNADTIRLTEVFSVKEWRC